MKKCLDMVGPLAVTERGNKYIAVFIDHFSHFAEIIPVMDQRSETIANVFVEQIVLNMEPRRSFLSDKGTTFCSELMKVSRLLGVKIFFYLCLQATIKRFK